MSFYYYCGFICNQSANSCIRPRFASAAQQLHPVLLHSSVYYLLVNSSLCRYGSTYGGPYAVALREPATTPPRLLLTFHNLAYADAMPGGTKDSSGSGSPSVIEAFYTAHCHGLAAAAAYTDAWAGLEGEVDAERFAAVASQLRNGLADARNFTAVLVAFFKNVSGIAPTAGECPGAM